MINKHFFKILIAFVGMLLLGIFFLFLVNTLTENSDGKTPSAVSQSSTVNKVRQR